MLDSLDTSISKKNKSYKLNSSNMNNKSRKPGDTTQKKKKFTKPT